jgi:hypothetical protein
MGEEDFLHYNFVELQKIARGKEGQRKQWLREYLKACSDSPWKKELVKPFRAGLTPNLGMKTHLLFAGQEGDPVPA